MNWLAAGQIGSVNVEFEGTYTMSFPRARRAVICATILGLAIISQSPLALAKGFPVNQVIAAIKSEINSARLARRKGGHSLEIISVDVTLTAVATYEGEFGIKLEIPIVGRVGGILANLGGQLANTQIISLTLVPEGGPILVGGSKNLGLLPAIQSVKAAMQTEAKDDFRLELQKFAFEVQFAITKTEQGEVKFLFVDAKAAHEDIAIQRIQFHMKPRK